MAGSAVAGTRSRARGGATAGRLYVPLAVLFSLLWASAFEAVKIGLHAGAPPLFLMGARFLVAGGVLLLIALATGQALPRGGREWARLAVLGLLNYGVYLGISAFALSRISAGLAAVLASTNPLLLALVARPLMDETIGGIRAAGLALAFASVAGIMASRLNGHLDTPAGIALILVANCFLVAGTVLFKRWRPEEPLAVLNGVQLSISGLALLLPSLVLEPVAGVRPTLELVAAMAWLALAVSLGGMTIWFLLLRSGDAARATSFFFLNPVFGLLLGALLLAEPLRPADFAGTAGVAVGLWLVQRGGSRAVAAAEPAS